MTKNLFIYYRLYAIHIVFVVVVDLLNRCNVVAFGSTGQLGAVAMDCDRVVFHGEAPQLPYGAPIVSFSQRFSGQQVLPSQVSFLKLLVAYILEIFLFKMN